MSSIVDEALKRAQEAWLDEFELLDNIAVRVVHSRHGAFLKKFAAAWLHADAFNKRIIRVAWVLLIEKYDLQKDPDGEVDIS